MLAPVLAERVLKQLQLKVPRPRPRSTSPPVSLRSAQQELPAVPQPAPVAALGASGVDQPLHSAASLGPWRPLGPPQGDCLIRQQPPRPGLIPRPQAPSSQPLQGLRVMPFSSWALEAAWTLPAVAPSSALLALFELLLVPFALSLASPSPSSPVLFALLSALSAGPAVPLSPEAAELAVLATPALPAAEKVQVEQVLQLQEHRN
mmetsp:Transcript_29999/g.54340  ORF Transcript_29999/g.54340 Transcript_29999/m.54340 type:complete len:205 (-) Transcript_29999:105-719(-)